MESKAAGTDRARTVPRADARNKTAVSDSNVRIAAQLRAPLHGAGVIVTRPAGTAVALLRRLRRDGAETMTLPGLSLRAAADADAARAGLRAALRGDGMVFISPAAVRFAWQLLPQLRLPRRLRVCAVGAATARALQRRGAAQVLAPSGSQDSEGLLAEAALRGLRGQSWAIVSADSGRDTLPAGLRRRGAAVSLVEVYRRVAPRWSRLHYARLETLARPLIVLVSSAQVLGNLATGLPAGLVLALRAAELVVSSTRLAALAREHGFTRIHVAESALPADLAAGALQALAKHRL
jgi:uroporphyrinogen-III synthase